MRVRLYDKATFPRRKLCGGFLSPESLMDLEQLEMLESLLQQGAHTIRRTVVSSPSGRIAEAPLPAPGLSITREILDTLLIERARAVGVEVHEATRAPETLDAEWRIVATGRAPHPPAAAGEAYFGLQAFFTDVPDITDQVELDIVNSGYVGLVRQGLEQVNVCALTTRTIFETAGATLDDVLKIWLKQNPLLHQRLQGARRVSAWLAVGPVTMGVQQLTGARTLFTGDAACVVDPFAGEGMAMALRSAQWIRNAFDQTEIPLAEAYEKAWHQHFDSALRFHRWTRFTMSHPALHESLVYTLKAFPQALTWLTRMTRPPIYENTIA